jgi:hypothetical protein
MYSSHRVDSTMFEQHIDRTIEFLTRQTLDDKQSILYRDIESSALPASVKKFFDFEAEKRKEEERQRLVTSPRFSYADPDVLVRFDEIMTLAKACAIFTRDEFYHLLDATVKLLFNFVCRPQFTLISYIFKDTEHVRIDTLLDRMMHFSDYEYYRIILKEYARSKGISEINRNRFEELLGLIDHEVIRNFDSHKLGGMTRPIFDFFHLEDASEFSRVPIEALTVFYDDKNLSTVVERLEAEKTTSSSLSMHELIMLIGDVDYGIGTDIRNLVSKHIGGPAGSSDSVGQQYTESASAPLAQHTDSFQVVPDLLADEELVQDIDDVISQEENSLLAGVHDTPDFGEIDEKLPGTLTETIEEESLPDDLFIEKPEDDRESDRTHEISESLEISLDTAAQPGDDDFLSELKLDEKEFLPVREAFEDIPDNVILPQGGFRMNTEEDAVEDEEADEEDDELHVEEPPPAILVDQPAQPPDTQEATINATEVIAQLGDLRSTITPKDKKKYVKKLFGRNEAEFDRALDALNGKSTWREASEHIDEVFLHHNVDMYSRVAVEFTDVVYKRYIQKKS